MLKHWKISGVMTYGSGRPANAEVSGDPNQASNTSKDRLAGYGRNAFTRPDYATMNLRVGKRVKLGGPSRLDLNAESFNLFNRDNKTYVISAGGFYNSAGIKYPQNAAGTYFPAYYQQPTSFAEVE